MSQPLLLPESVAPGLKACYDAEKDVILMDEETQQKARSKRRPTADMVVSGEGADIRINACGVRWSRRITKKSLPRRSVICYRYIVTIGPHKFNSIKIAQRMTVHLICATVTD
ncbi:hypothetical protein MJ585_22710 [Klebsiella pneumoniae]|nr:hypothetical protein MJ585_22710 [Klebsiella pneumoniae]